MMMEPFSVIAEEVSYLGEKTAAPSVKMELGEEREEIGYRDGAE